MKTIAKLLVLTISVFAAVQVFAAATTSEKESAKYRDRAGHESPGV